jgi:hypothetical protein
VTLLTGPPAVNQSTATFQRSPPSGLLERKPQKATDIQGLKQSTWYSTAMKNMEEGEYHFNKVADSDTYSTPNRKNNLRFYYDESGFTVQPRVTQIPVGDKDLTTPPDEIKYKTLPDWKVAFNLDKEQIGEGTWQIAEIRLNIKQTISPCSISTTWKVCGKTLLFKSLYRKMIP